MTLLQALLSYQIEPIAITKGELSTLNHNSWPGQLILVSYHLHVIV